MDLRGTLAAESDHEKNDEKSRLDGLFLAAALVTGSSARGQVAGGTILGTVTDQTGAVIASAQVIVTNTRTGVVRTAATNGDGFYTVRICCGRLHRFVHSRRFRRDCEHGVTLTVGASSW